ncbi:MAG TPA: DMT family transporter [Magnetospirillaceae bacterium]|jgi:drug/metabolite transporter (DMT)-like permease
MNQAPNPTMRAAEWVLLLILSLLWGGSFFFAKIAVGELPPLLVVLLRVAIAAIILLAVLRLTGLSSPRDGRSWRNLFIMGLLNNAIPFALFFWAQTHIPSGLAAILNGTTPLFGVIVAQLVGQERMTVARVIGVLLGIVGVAVMIGPALLAGLGSDAIAEIACLCAALSYAFAGVFGRHYLRALQPMVTATGQLIATTVVMVPVVALTVPGLGALHPSLTVIGAMIGLAVLSTALAYVLYFRILAAAGSTNLLLVTQVMPITTILLSWGFLGEHLQARHLAGMAIIALGFAATDGRVFQRLKRPAPSLGR